MAQRKFIIDGGFKTDDASELLANLTMGGSILPNVDSNGVTGYDLGSTTAKWKDLYLSAGSLYVNNQKVLEDDSGTIVVSADVDQGVSIKTTGTGVVTLQSATTVNMAGTLQMGAGKNITDVSGVAVSFGDKIDMSNNNIINVGTAVNATDVANKSYVDQQVSNLVNGAPGALDTLNELADALGNDAAFSATVTANIATNAASIVSTNSTVANNATQIASNVSAIATNATAIGTKANTSYVDSQDASQLATTLADATTKADAAQVAAAADATTKADAALLSATGSATLADSTVTAAYIAADVIVASNASTDATTKADAAELAAIASAEAKDIARMVTSDAYADASEAAAVATASADATSKANTALADGKVYTDTGTQAALSGADAAARTYTDAEIATAISTAASTAESKDVARMVTSDAYADASEAAAVATASADATSKANAARAGAVSDVTNGAGAAFDTLVEIQNAMATDAELSSAIASVTSSAASTASADATTKADAALAAAKVYADANDANTTYSNLSEFTNGPGYITSYTDTNTTYTAGNGMSLSGTQFLMSGNYTGSFTATGDITAYSDDSLKTNVQVIDGALGRVEAIRGVTFERIEDGSVSTGVIAQELKAVLPEAVHTDENGIHSVAYGNITGLLIEAVKELSAQVAELKAK